MNAKVKEYFSRQPSNHRQILQQLRELILNTLPEANEDFLWGVPVYDGGRYYLAGLKKQVNFGFAIKGLSADELKLFEGTGKTMRHIKVYKYTPEIENKLTELIKLVKEKAEFDPAQLS